MDYKKLNNYVGLMIFIFATVVYTMTIEPTTSLWDCGEYITTSYKLEVGHPPGAPLYMMMGRLFSMFGTPETAALLINFMSALASSFTILFLFWTITLIAKKTVLNPEIKLFGAGSDDTLDGVKKDKIKLTDGYKWAIIGSGLIGALAYTFTDTFWFSAVEGEVYAMSSFFTAIVFWAILKWDNELQMKEDTPDDEEVVTKKADRWLMFIFFMIGLSIGVHLLNLLCIPAIAYVIYFRKFKETTIGGFILTGVIGIAVLGIIQAVIVPKTVEIAGYFERTFVNSFGMPFNAGTAFFFMLMTAVIAGVLFYSRKSNNVLLNTITWSASMIFIGYSCFAMIVIRSNANTPLDENDPENLVSLQAYLQREQYGDWPIMYGQYFTADYLRDASGNPDRDKWADRSDVYLRRFVVTNALGEDLKGFKTEEDALAYAEIHTGTVEEKYYKTFDGTGQKPVYDPKHSSFFPRMYSSDARHVNGYKKWSGHVGNKVPTMGENLTYFGAYQIDWMYWRYFMWNFSGRQSDEQGHGEPQNGNWLSGLNFIDKHHIGDQTYAPGIITNNPSHNKYYMLPLILGLMGFIFLLMKATKGWWIIMLLFMLTGFAIIIYLNQKPYEPRERDYAYAASFYAFSMFIGFSVMAMYDAFKNMVWKDLMYIVGAIVAVGVVFGLTDATASLSMIYMGVVIALLLGLMVGLKKVFKKDNQAAIFSTLLLLPIPILMGAQAWDDHDRSNRYTAQALAYNYLMSCDDNAIIYTNGDNDTFPLWYLQEVEGVKTSVRVCNLSLLNTDWYTEQMTKQAYDSKPLPISFTEEQYRQNGYRDYLYVLGTNDLTMNSPELLPKWKTILDIKIQSNPVLFKDAFRIASSNLHMVLTPSKFPEMQAELYDQLPGFDSTKTYFEFRNLVFHLLAKGEEFGLEVTQLQSIQNIMLTFNDAFDYLPADVAMEYLSHDENLEDRGLFILPSKGLSIDVDKEKVLANGIVHERDADRIVEKLRWIIPKQTMFKSDLMILDMVAHFDWERPIYFASSASQDTYLGLTKYFYAEGLVYKLVPIEVVRNRNPNSMGEVNLPKMYENLMYTFKWGNMDIEGTLVDYYTRRLTNNYRVQFSVLADAYVESIEKNKQMIEMYKQIQSQDGPPEQVIKTPIGDFVKGDVSKLMAEAQMSIDSNTVKVSEVLDRSFIVMPEVNIPFGRVLPSYISSYYAVDNQEKAELYSNRMVEIFQEDIDYYTSLDPEFSSALINDLFDAYRGIFSLYQSSQLFSTNEEFKTKMYDTFINVTNSIKIDLQDIRKHSSKTQQTVQQTFDAFFAQIGA